MTSKSALQEILKGTLNAEERPKVTKTRKNQRKSPEMTKRIQNRDQNLWEEFLVIKVMGTA